MRTLATSLAANPPTAPAHAREPVSGFPMKYVWQDVWVPIFDLQIALIREDILRARAEDRLVVYLSCPISARGGGFPGANVEIAKHTQRRLQQKWGYRFWILNPAQYQLESKEGTGLIVRHAKALGMTPDQIAALPAPRGGDYMRMWTKILVESGISGDHTGDYFDGYYFLGPSDVHDFMTDGGAVSVTAGVEEYFARQDAMDPDLRDTYAVAGIEWRSDLMDPKAYDAKGRQKQLDLRQEWERRRKEFFRYYALRASAAFSLGSHDEWNIFLLTNERRLIASGGDVGQLLAGYFDGSQIAPGALAVPIALGYEKK